MRLLFIIIIYTLLNSVLFSQVIFWISKFNHLPCNFLIRVILSIIYFLCYMSVIMGFFLKKSKIQRIIQKIANQFMGILVYILLISCVFILLQVTLVYGFKVDNSLFFQNSYLLIVSIITSLLVIVISIYGNIHAKKIYTKHYNVEISNNQKFKKLRIALVADFHLGYSTGSKMIEQMKNIINREKVDIVLIAGDIFDNSYELVDDITSISKSLSNIKSKYGTFAVFGNHDIDEKLFSGFSTKSIKKTYRNKEMDNILLNSNIKVLNDQIYELDNCYIIGRKDFEKTGEVGNSRDKLEKLINKIDSDKPIIVLEHQPRNLKKIAEYNVDLHLAGHTHAGQYFPLNIGTKLIWDNHYGIKKIGNMYSIVTSGIGVYGPNMRVGTNSEVVIIDVSYQKK